MRLVVDGIEAPQIRAVLESNIQTMAHEEMLAAEMYEAMGRKRDSQRHLSAIHRLIKGD